MSFWRQNLAFFKLAIKTNLEYRLNFFADALLQPMLSSLIELTLWFAVFKAAGVATVAGHSLESYLAYALWASFMARITSTWMYEFRMSDEIDTGSVNAILIRPMSFFGYYLWQFMGYKAVTSLFSLTFPLLICLFFELPVKLEYLPMGLLMVGYYLIFVKTLSFLVASQAFRISKVSSLTIAKNLSLWVFSGELFPLDLYPTAIAQFMIHLPFANAVYLPVGLLTGRLDFDQAVVTGLWSTTWGLLLLMPLAAWSWKQGLRHYAGTGA